LLELLSDAVRDANSIHFSVLLRADDAGGSRPDGTYEPSIVAPATYLKNKDSAEGGGPRINVIAARDRTEVRTVLNSVGAEAHRLLSALKAGIEDVAVPFPGLAVEGRTPSGEAWRLDGLDAPHRSSDAYFRLTTDWDKFDPWTMGVNQLDLRDDVTKLYQRSPHVLFTGGWNSYKRVAARIPRALTSTIDGITILPPNFEVATNARVRDSVRDSIIVNVKAQRTDPLVKGHQIALPASLVSAPKPTGKKKPDDDKQINISTVGIGDIPASKFTGRVMIDYAIAKTTLSLAALRMYRFPKADGSLDIARDAAGRTVVAALFLLAYELASQRGYFLRSGCSLVPNGPATRVIIGADGGTPSLPWDQEGRSRVEVARELYVAAVAAAANRGLVFDADRVLIATAELNEIVGLSTRLQGAEELEVA
jgi:CRISPR-associated protein Csb1